MNTTITKLVSALPATVKVDLTGSFSLAPRGNWNAGVRATNSTDSGVGVAVGLSVNTVGKYDNGEEYATGVQSSCDRILSADEAERFALAILSAVHTARSIEGQARAAAYQAEQDALYADNEWYRADQKAQRESVEKRSEELRQPRD